MKDGKWFKFVMICLFLVFITLYISQATGYYDYQQYKKVELTAEKMKQFEEDVKNGKNIDIKDYLETNDHNYDNEVSNIGLKLSTLFKKGFKKIIEGTFGSLGKLVTD